MTHHLYIIFLSAKFKVRNDVNTKTVVFWNVTSYRFVDASIFTVFWRWGQKFLLRPFYKFCISEVLLNASSVFGRELRRSSIPSSYCYSNWIMMNHLLACCWDQVWEKFEPQTWSRRTTYSNQPPTTYWNCDKIRAYYKYVICIYTGVVNGSNSWNFKVMLRKITHSDYFLRLEVWL